MIKPRPHVLIGRGLMTPGRGRSAFTLLDADEVGGQAPSVLDCGASPLMLPANDVSIWAKKFYSVIKSNQGIILSSPRPGSQSRALCRTVCTLSIANSTVLN